MARHSFCYPFTGGIAVSAIVLLLFFCPLSAQAADSGQETKTPETSPGWQARIVGNEASPSRLIAVDKKAQTLFLFERHSPLRLAKKYICTTGQSEGDKLVEGDLKTPEGVYFVIQRIASGLDFEKYGTEAYTLNYPNPVDRLRRKTGYGIWIHGRGVPITPNLTEGCVSLNNPDIAVLGKDLSPGTPVALAYAIDFEQNPTTNDKAIVESLYNKTHGWAKAWSGRSKKFFDYYDSEAYAAAQGESFSNFRQQKERIFKRVSFIDTTVSNMQALQGPGYWVTWFQQDYRASNLSTQGVRRLYWQKDKKGEFRIVGMEWEPSLSGTLTAGINGAPITQASASKPEKATDDPVSVAMLTPSPTPVPTPPPAEKKPTPAAPSPAVQVAPDRNPAPENTELPTPSATPTPPTDQTGALALVDIAKETPQKPVEKPQDAEPNSPPPVADVNTFIESWRTAWETGDLNAYAACYGKDAVQGSRTSATAIRDHKARLWRTNHPVQVVLTNVRITSKQGIVVADMLQAYTATNSFADMGVKTLHLQAKGNTWQIIHEDWNPM